jgi:hypothetical protein
MNEDNEILQFAIDVLKQQKYMWESPYGESYRYSDPTINNFIKKIDKSIELLEKIKSPQHTHQE